LRGLSSPLVSSRTRQSPGFNIKPPRSLVPAGARALSLSLSLSVPPPPETALCAPFACPLARNSTVDFPLVRPDGGAPWLVTVARRFHARNRPSEGRNLVRRHADTLSIVFLLEIGRVEFENRSTGSRYVQIPRTHAQRRTQDIAFLEICRREGNSLQGSCTLQA